MKGNRILALGAGIIAMAATAAQAGPQRRTAPTIPEELRAISLEDLFTRMDANKDGRLTKMEVRTFGADHNVGSLINTSLWKRIDANRNGTLTMAEVLAYRKAMEERQARARPSSKGS